MKKIFFTAAILFLCTGVFAQQISKITFAATGMLETLSLAIDDNVMLNLDDAGVISKWGLEPYNLRTENYGDYTDKLDPYVGRVEYYTANDNEAFRGKVKYIGRTLITYYASYDEESLKGKVKSIGTNAIEYYRAVEDKAFAGKIKNIGSAGMTYFSSFDNEGYRGKLKSVGSSTINYYASFDDKAFAGKIKSIGNVSFSYYGSYDKPEYRGRMKVNSPIQHINGIKYYIKY